MAERRPRPLLRLLNHYRIEPNHGFRIWHIEGLCCVAGPFATMTQAAEVWQRFYDAAVREAIERQSEPRAA